MQEHKSLAKTNTKFNWARGMHRDRRMEEWMYSQLNVRALILDFFAVCFFYFFFSPSLFVLATVEHFLQLAFAEKEFVDTNNVSDILANNSFTPLSCPPVGNWQLSQHCVLSSWLPAYVRRTKVLLLFAVLFLVKSVGCAKVRTSFLALALIKKISLR